MPRYNTHMEVGPYTRRDGREVGKHWRRRTSASRAKSLRQELMAGGGLRGLLCRRRGDR